MGSGAFGIPSLLHLLSRADVDLGVVTQPNRPAGRGQNERPTPVAETVGTMAPLKKYKNVNDPAAVEDLRNMTMDILIVCDFGQILKPPLLALPAIGPFNLHGSLLPAYRGAAPIQRALLDAVRQTGVTFLRVNERCDAGPIVSQTATNVDPLENFGAVHERLSNMAVPLLKTFLDQCLKQRPPEVHPQDESKATPAPKIKKEELRLGFDRPADELLRRILAFSPAPGAYALYQETRLKFLKAKPVPAEEWPAGTGSAQNGTIQTSADRRMLIVSCARNTFLGVEEIQPEGSRTMTAKEFLNGHTDMRGRVLG